MRNFVTGSAWSEKKIFSPPPLTATLLMALAALLAAASPASAQEQWDGPFFFIHMADPQLGIATKNKDFVEEARNFRQALEEANSLGPAFILICGDLVNRPGDEAQIAEFFRIIEEKKDPAVPIYWTSGNHDVSGAPTPERLEFYRERFGPDRYAFSHGGCRFISLNSTIIAAPKRVIDEELEQRAWFEAELKDASADGATHIIVFQHHPWYLDSPGEEYVFYNTIARQYRKPYMELMAEHGVTATLAGHIHRNNVAAEGEMVMVCAGPICRPFDGSNPGFRVVRVSRDGIEHESVELGNIPMRLRLELPAIAGAGSGE